MCLILHDYHKQVHRFPPFCIIHSGCSFLEPSNYTVDLHVIAQNGLLKVFHKYSTFHIIQILNMFIIIYKNGTITKTTECSKIF